MKLFCLGLFVGGSIGYIIAGICHAAKDNF